MVRTQPGSTPGMGWPLTCAGRSEFPVVRFHGLAAFHFKSRLISWATSVAPGTAVAPLGAGADRGTGPGLARLGAAGFGMEQGAARPGMVRWGKEHGLVRHDRAGQG